MLCISFACPIGSPLVQALFQPGLDVWPLGIDDSAPTLMPTILLLSAT